MKIDWKTIQRYASFAVPLLIVIAIGIVGVLIGPEKIVESLGVRNTYITLFFLAIFGGASTFTSSTYYATIVVVTLGGLNPFAVAAISGIGLTIGDGLFFYLGARFRDTFLLQYEKKIRRVSRWLEKHQKFTPLFIFFYAGFTPFPGDLLMLFLSITEYPYRKAILPILAGNTALAFLIAILAMQGIKVV